VNCLDSSFLIDLLQDGADHHPGAVEYLEANQHRSFSAATVTFVEIYRYLAWECGPEGVADTEVALDWVQPAPLTCAAAKEAAVIDAELKAAGERLASWMF
jgi:tRNA(fMet)-specific endonuclease VapC